MMAYRETKMFIMLSISIYLLTFLVSAAVCTEGNPLNGQHLRVVASEFPTAFTSQRNASGYVTDAIGVEKHLLEALSQMFNFSYTYLPISAPLFDDSLFARGASYYLIQDEADLHLGVTIATPSRFQIADFPSSWYQGPFSTLIPYPSTGNFDLAASFKPLSYENWILVVISTCIVILCLTLIEKYRLIFCPTTEIHSEDSNKAIASNNKPITKGGFSLYVIGNLFSQGQNIVIKKLAIRIVAGAWCCGCFFLVQIYSSTLTSHLTAPNQKPLVNSFFEIAEHPGVTLTIDRGYAIDKYLEIGKFRFSEVLRNSSRLILCNKTVECLGHVNGGKAVYAAPQNVILSVIAVDLKNNAGACRYSETKERFWNTPLYVALQKNSPYTKSMSKGILRLQAAGLLEEWNKWYVPIPSKCLELNQRKIKTPRLSLKHLSSAFVILIAGLTLSLLSFLAEQIGRFSRIRSTN